MKFNEQTMNLIETYQVHNSSSQFIKLSLMNFHEQAMYQINTYEVHNNSSMFMKPSHEL